MSGFKVETEQQPGVVVVRLFGEFDLSAFEEVDEVLAGVQLNGNPHLVVDLRSLQFIDSSGIRALLGARVRAGLVGGRLRLIRGPDRVHRVFELAGVDSRFDFVEGDERSRGGSRNGTAAA
jgi:anti-sigma B factor antagonist